MTPTPHTTVQRSAALEVIRSLLQQGISVRIHAWGHSMKPLLNGGEIVEIAPLSGRTPQLGDLVLLCNEEENTLLHRVVRHRRIKQALYLQTKGDACPHLDPFFPVDQVLGYVRRIIVPNAGSNVGGITTLLDTPFIRLHAFCIVCRGRMRYHLRSIRTYCSHLRFLQ